MAYSRAKYLRYVDTYKNGHLKRKHGITLADFFDLMDAQNNKCSICSVSFEEIGRKRTHLDHCHKTEKIRGVLCNNCNQALGLLKDDVNTLKSAIAYLEKHNAED